MLGRGIKRRKEMMRLVHSLVFRLINSLVIGIANNLMIHLMNSLMNDLINSLGIKPVSGLVPSLVILLLG